MFYEFSFSNFRSYKNEATIGFIAKPISEFEDTLLHGGETELLPVCAIYGPNGGGKSSVLMAIKSLQNIVLSPLTQLAFMKKKNEMLADLSMDEIKKNVSVKNEESSFYKWDNAGKDIPTEYSILFQMDSDKYRYELKIMKDSVVEENLYIEDIEGNTDALFERDEEGVYLCDELDGLDIENMNEGLPLLSYIGMFKNIKKIDNALRFFYNIQTINFDMPTRDRTIFVKSLERDKKRILNVMQSMGIDISDVRIEYEEDGNVREVYTKHKLENGLCKELKFHEESSGTRKIFSILPVILSGIDKGRFFVIDELDAKLHPALLQRIIELFTDQQVNLKGAQMLFTSHDMTTMSNKVFRRDEIWFSAINSHDESVLYSLVDFRKENGKKTRNDEIYSKQYLEGRYGADPYLKRIVNWEVTN
ncbi:MAG: ATP-binding protein [Clostridiales bacterium]|nr:ATP-binding protein [Clostridiales bacterium]